MTPANKNLQKEALRVLEYIYETRGKKIILGQHTQSMPQEELSYIESVTGSLPALCGFELLAYSPNINFSDSDKDCLDEVNAASRTLEKAWEWAEKGGLITFTWHWFSPLGGRDKSFFTRNTDFDASQAVIEGTPEYTALLSDMDYMAGLLRPFRDRHVPILWRPFHECEGDWFWWGACPAGTTRKLYRMMFERFVGHYRLDNMIWVFNSTDKERFPGGDVVDIITRDMYPPAHEHTACEEMLRDMERSFGTDKPIAIGETGTIPDVYAITKNAVPWCWSMTWSHEFCLTEDYTTKWELRRAYECENAVTLDRLPKFYKIN